MASKSGVPLMQAFNLVSRVVENVYYEQRILEMRDGVERGESMLRVTQSAGIFTPLEVTMIAVVDHKELALIFATSSATCWSPLITSVLFGCSFNEPCGL